MVDWQIKKVAQAVSSEKPAVLATLDMNSSTPSSSGEKRAAWSRCKPIAASCSVQKELATNKLCARAVLCGKSDRRRGGSMGVTKGEELAEEPVRVA